MKKVNFSFGIIFASTLAVLFAGSSVFSSTEIAKINDSSLSLEEFTQKYKDSLKYYQGRTPTKKAFLDNLIKKEVGVQEAKKLGLDKDPEVQDRINTILVQALLEKKLGNEIDEIHVTDEAAKEFYEKYPEIRTSHIFVAVPPGAKPADEKQAYERIKKIQDQYLKDQKLGFSEVAQRYSDGIAAPMGGDIDYQTKDKLDPAYYEAAIKLKTPGKISGIVRSQYGYHIIKLTAVRPWEESDKPHVKRMVFEETRTKSIENFMEKLRQTAKVSVNSQLISDKE